MKKKNITPRLQLGKKTILLLRFSEQHLLRGGTLLTFGCRVGTDPNTVLSRSATPLQTCPSNGCTTAPTQTCPVDDVK